MRPPTLGTSIGLVLADQGRQAAAVLLLDLLRLGHGGPQADGDVVGQVVAAQGEHRGVLDGPVGEDGDVGGAAADVHQADAQFLLVGGEHRLGRGQLLQHDVGHVQAGPVAGFDDVLGAGHGAGDDVHLGLQADAAHAERLADAVLLVDDELLGQDMDDLPVHGDGDGLGGVDDAAHVLLGDLAVLDGDDALGVDPLDVAAGDPGVDRFDLAAGHQLRLFDGLADRGDRALDVDDHPLAQPARRAGADADDVDPVLGDVADDGADLGGADVETDDQIFPFAC